MPDDSINARRLLASGQDPDLSVHAVSEYLFCQRAGVLAHESPGDDYGSELRPVRLGWFPRYDLRRLERRIGQLTAAILIVGVVLCTGLVGAMIGAMKGSAVALLLGFLLLTVLAVSMAAGVILLGMLVWRLQAARRAQPQEPEFADDEMVTMSWWSLLASGYELHDWPDVMTAEDWRLNGHPWRVLARGRTVIPVILSKVHGKDASKPRKNHFARVAAYCGMIEKQAGVASPFGVLLYADRDQCVVIRHSPVSRLALADGVRGMRELAILTLKYPDIARRPEAARCHHCPLGDLSKPHAGEAGTRIGAIIARNKKQTESRCGHRFGWTPPHVSHLRREGG